MLLLLSAVVAAVEEEVMVEVEVEVEVLCCAFVSLDSGLVGAITTDSG
jgi:hypothetical protein